MKGIGIDIVNANNLSKDVADKILSPKELIEFNDYMKTDKERAMDFLAGRLAAKEAYFKAIGISKYDGINLSDFSIYKDENGIPKFKGIKNARLTVSHESGFAVAFVIVE